MAKLAIFIDGGYYNALSTRHYNVRLDFPKFISEVTNIVASKTPEPIEVLRTLFFDCLPYQSATPTAHERQLYANKLGFFNYLETLPRVQVRKGVLAYRGNNDKGQPIFMQKKVDLLLGLDFAELSTKGHITHLALIAGDSDYCPAVEFAKRESVCVWLFHGPAFSPITRESTYAQELWTLADERHQIDQAFINKVKRQ